jgi:hypothetical protein
MKVQRKPDSFYIVGYLLELMIKNMKIWDFFPSKNGEFCVKFFHENPFVLVEIIFFRSYLLTYLQFSISRWAKVPGPEPN